MSTNCITIPRGESAQQYAQSLTALVDACRSKGAMDYYSDRADEDYYTELLGEMFSKVILKNSEAVVGFGILKYLSQTPEYLKGVPLPGVEITKAAVLAGALLHPDWRGKGLGHLLAGRRIEDARKSGTIEHMFATSHPENAPSNRTLEKAGFIPLETKRIYDDHVLRTIYYLNLEA